ncbi:sensor histidine kinase [Kribbella deserti]|uniref:histidine kinase n=1 Tax=Kribbella deserti TaxID=1926257 RepID=A0ABV6QGV7_9ACTN
MECDEMTARPPRWMPPAAVAAIAVFTTATIVGRHTNSDGAGLLALDIAIGVLCCGLTLLLFTRPATGALPMALLAAASPAATTAATLGTLMTARRRPFRTAAAIALAGIAGHAVQGLWRPITGLGYWWYVVLVVAVHAALLAFGAMAHARQALLDSLRERAQRAEAEQERRVAEARAMERNLMAREMHDVLAHRLSLLATYAGALEYRPESSPEQIARAAGVVREGVHQALDELRDVIGVLRRSEIDHLSGESLSDGRPQPTVNDLARLVEESRGAGHVIRYNATLRRAELLPSATVRTAYRVMQEGLTNARRHAAGEPVTVNLQGEPGADLVISIVNHRSRLPTATVGSGMGLVGLTERVNLAGGQLDHRTDPEGRWCLEASLPWPS